MGGEGYFINPANTLKGLHIVVRYSCIRSGDRVCLSVVGRPGVGSPLLLCAEVQEGHTSVEFHLPPSVVSQNFGQAIRVFYTLQRDKVLRSPERWLQVFNPTGLKGLAIEEATDGTLNLNSFSGNATATVKPWDYMAVGQTCWLWIVGQLDDGSLFHWHILNAEPVTPEWVTHGFSATLNREGLQRLSDCRVFNMHFAVSFSGQAEFSDAIEFQPVPWNMVQEDWVLAAPSVREAVGDVLTAWDGRAGVTVRVAYDRISPDHTLTLCWESLGGCLPLPSQPGNVTPGYVDFLIPREAVIHAIGKTVPISFSVASLCKQPTSPILELQVSDSERMPTPMVVQANATVLDLGTFEGDAQVTVAPWWFILLAQKVWLSVVGTKKDGSPFTLDVYVDKAITADEVRAGLNGVLARSALELLKNRSQLAITCKVTPDGSSQESEAVVFPMLTLVVRSQLLYEVDDFEEYPKVEFRGLGSVIKTKLVDLELPEDSYPGIGLHVARGENEVVPGMVEGNALALRCGSVQSSQLAILRLTRKCVRVRFGYSSTGKDGATFTAFDENDQVLATREVIAPDWVEFQATDDQMISYINVVSLVHGSIDSFGVWYEEGVEGR